MCPNNMTDFCSALRAAGEYSPLSSVYIYAHELTAFEEYLKLNTGVKILKIYSPVFSDTRIECELQELDHSSKGPRLIWLTVRPPPDVVRFDDFKSIVEKFVSCLPKNIKYFYAYEVKATTGAGLHLHFCTVSTKISDIYRNARGKFQKLFQGVFNIPRKVSCRPGGFYFQTLPSTDEIWADKVTYLIDNKYHNSVEQTDLKVARTWREKLNIPHFIKNW